ncbi:MAG: hypothetical protein KDB63_06885 [Nocardioidaceae bacterium]|nr:hypothetical protein [Nocardioidaceae bacterium]
MSTSDVQCVCVHGPAGVLDLAVPWDTTARQVAEEYARQSSLEAIPVLLTALGGPVLPDRPLVESGVRAGDVVVAVATVLSAGPSARMPVEPAAARAPAGAGATAWVAVAAALAVASGWLAAHLDAGSQLRSATVGALVVAAVLGVLPAPGAARQRTLAAPAFAGAAAFVVAWEPTSGTLPLVLGLAGLAAAATAAAARALAADPHEGLVVWLVSGGSFFVLSGGCALLGLGPAVVWSVALVAAMLATRLVPALAVDVPDQLLVDLERLAVTAWSARERPRGRRGRAVVPTGMVADVADRGGRIVTAGAVAIAVVTVAAARGLLVTADVPVDRVGARLLVVLVGAVLLLAARHHRHRLARACLRVGGVLAWLAVTAGIVDRLDERQAWWLVAAATVVAVVLVVASVATGRGWRSAWWSRRAELVEVVAGSVAVASVVVSSGLFRHLWEIASTMFSTRSPG